MGKKSNEDMRRAHNYLLEGLGWMVKLPVEVVMKMPLKGIVALHDALEDQAGRPSTAHKSRAHQNKKNDHHYN